MRFNSPCDAFSEDASFNIRKVFSNKKFREFSRCGNLKDILEDMQKIHSGLQI
jgi:hypothetical protein